MTSPVSLHKSFGDYPGKVRAPNQGVEIVGLRERSDCQVEASEARTMIEGSFLPRASKVIKGFIRVAGVKRYFRQGISTLSDPKST